MRIVFTENPQQALNEAGAFLTAEPVKHNLILSLLHDRVTQPEPGRYWMSDGAVAFQSPLTFPLIIVGASTAGIEALADAMCDADITLPGVLGEASAAARFAGHWSERRKVAATPLQGQRLYELSVPHVLSAHGAMRRAIEADRDLLIDWMQRFNTEVGHDAMDVAPMVDRRAFYIWENNGPVAMVAHTDPLETVVRVQYVYTPIEHRRRGYAGACVAQLSMQLHKSGLRCVLYTDLGNPTSNSIYRRIGYRAVQEGVRYKFEQV
jgi:hypothetical protein